MNRKSAFTTDNGMVKPLSSYCVFYAYLFVLTHLRSIWALIGYLRTVIFDFFFLQFSVKFRLRSIEVISVDHELDESVPFLPQKVCTYLDFVNFWIRPLAFFCRRTGRRGVPQVVEYLNLINKCYQQAALVYKFKMSTTNRPTDYVDKHFKMIRTLDPHFLCVPSLHVAIVILASHFFPRAFNRPEFSGEEQKAYTAELYQGALDIAETVLFVKQHSVNCISAALYMMIHVIPDDFTIKDATAFIDRLFIDCPEIPAADAAKIHEHLHQVFEQLLLESCYDHNWVEPLKRWLLRYQEQKS